MLDSSSELASLANSIKFNSAPRLQGNCRRETGKWRKGLERRCRNCRHCHPQYEWYIRGHARKWGWNVVAYFVYHIIRLRVPQRAMERNLNTLFGFGVGHSTLNNFKTKAADYYLNTRMSILNRIIHGSLIHADETQANITGQLAYVWVLTNYARSAQHSCGCSSMRG
jgi:hypothetical protein